MYKNVSFNFRCTKYVERKLQAPCVSNSNAVQEKTEFQLLRDNSSHNIIVQYFHISYNFLGIFERG